MVYPNPSDYTREKVLDGDWREWIGISANGGALWRVMGPVCHHHDQRECFVFALSPGSLSNWVDNTNAANAFFFFFNSKPKIFSINPEPNNAVKSRSAEYMNGHSAK